MNKRIFSGMQPTGNLHLGNYLGALKNWVKLQDDYECFYCIMDLHAITLPQDPEALKKATREVACAYMASGIDVSKSNLTVQSALPAHTELSWILGTKVPLGWLNRMTQYKDKAGKNPGKQLLGLYSYPVLMAADILAYQAHCVPVGEDQKQHVELTRDIALSFNNTYGDYFTVPEPLIMGEATRIMSLRDGSKKMSKSDESDYSRLNMTDDADTIMQKIRKAKTDTLPLPETVKELEARPEADNLITIYASLGDMTVADVLKAHAGAQFSTFKKDLADLAIAKLVPITNRMRELMSDQAEIDNILKKGADKANALTQKHLREVKDRVGFW
ncbi:MAG TPA: tryptophan--tRNA ligase [Rhodospirillaceae bacterium]|nr:tryptophan--tRNA ligase [Rhodospirillaceae bacterium]